MRSKLTKFAQVATFGLALTFHLSCSSDDSGGNNNNNGNNNNANANLYCDFGPVTEYGGGCFPIQSVADCDTEWGQIVSTCGSSNNGGNNSNGGNNNGGNNNGGNNNNSNSSKPCKPTVYGSQSFSSIDVGWSYSCYSVPVTSTKIEGYRVSGGWYTINTVTSSPTSGNYSISPYRDYYNTNTYLAAFRVTGTNSSGTGESTLIVFDILLNTNYIDPEGPDFTKYH